jgi:hypothetical protein
MSKSLDTGLRVRLWRCGTAGGYEIQNVRCFFARMILSISDGEPFDHARRESEELAVVLDAEYKFEGQTLRESLTGKYFDKDEVKSC